MLSTSFCVLSLLLSSALAAPTHHMETRSFSPQLNGGSQLGAVNAQVADQINQFPGNSNLQGLPGGNIPGGFSSLQGLPGNTPGGFSSLQGLPGNTPGGFSSMQGVPGDSFPTGASSLQGLPLFPKMPGGGSGSPLSFLGLKSAQTDSVKESSRSKSLEKRILGLTQLFGKEATEGSAPKSLEKRILGLTQLFGKEAPEGSAPQNTLERRSDVLGLLNLDGPGGPTCNGQSDPLNLGLAHQYGGLGC